jgi:hypothetical protein
MGGALRSRQPLGAAAGHGIDLQTPDDQHPNLIVVAGYSKANTGSAYFSGARFDVNGNSPQFFRSSFSGSYDDVGRAVRVDNNRKIVAGGFHTVGSPDERFAALRTCKNPDDNPDCTPHTGGGNAPSAGGGGADSPTAASLLVSAALPAPAPAEPAAPAAEDGTAAGPPAGGDAPAPAAMAPDAVPDRALAQAAADAAIATPALEPPLGLSENLLSGDVA